jgi:broad specificity phosphatase PhoE
MTDPVDGRVIRLVRHGRAAAGWDADPDPDLDDLGREQAAAVAAALHALGPLVVVSSPLLRCRSTAQVYADLAAAPVGVAADVAEIPSPEGVEMGDRVGWLREAMHGTWAALGPRYTSYRDGVVDFVRSCDDSTVIFSHFVAINTVIGACLGRDELVLRSLDNCSVTTVVASDSGLRLVEGGHEADTLIR